MVKKLYSSPQEVELTLTLTLFFRQLEVQAEHHLQALKC